MQDFQKKWRGATSLQNQKVDMMRFMILIYGSAEKWSKLSASEMDEIGTIHKKIQKELSESKELLDHKELLLEGAKLIKRIEGEATIEDGPFSEGTETVAGYYYVNCKNLKRAMEIASQFLESKFSPIEVRKVSADSSWD